MLRSRLRGREQLLLRTTGHGVPLSDAARDARGRTTRGDRRGTPATPPHRGFGGGGGRRGGGRGVRGGRAPDRGGAPPRPRMGSGPVRDEVHAGSGDPRRDGSCHRTRTRMAADLHVRAGSAGGLFGSDRVARRGGGRRRRRAGRARSGFGRLLPQDLRGARARAAVRVGAVGGVRDRRGALGARPACMQEAR